MSILAWPDQVAKAWEVLGDPQQRSLYDAQRCPAPAQVFCHGGIGHLFRGKAGKLDDNV